MYVTRPLSLYNSAHAVTEPPVEPEGPGSGVLVITDGAAEEQTKCCWGTCKTPRLSHLPFPQNRVIEVRYTSRLGLLQLTYSDDVFFVPVIDQPLSSNRYYVVRAHGKNKGKICACSKEEDASTFCFRTSANDVEPRPFDHTDIYQQVEIIRTHGHRFYAKSLAPDGIPPHFLRRKGWRAYASESLNFSLGEAKGMNTSLRARMPDLDSSPVVIGKWYCPSVFVKEVEQLKYQMRQSMFYEMSLEQYWEEIYSCENGCGQGKVNAGVSVGRETAMLNGNAENVGDGVEIDDGVVWFKRSSEGGGFGLSMVIWERMRWEAERGGWERGEEVVERVEREEVFEGRNGWEKFGCYVLVERFVLKRINGMVALCYEFKNTSKVRIRWE